VGGGEAACRLPLTTSPSGASRSWKKGSDADSNEDRENLWRREKKQINSIQKGKGKVGRKKVLLRDKPAMPRPKGKIVFYLKRAKGKTKRLEWAKLILRLNVKARAGSLRGRGGATGR